MLLYASCLLFKNASDDTLMQKHAECKSKTAKTTENHKIICIFSKNSLKYVDKPQKQRYIHVGYHINAT